MKIPAMIAAELRRLTSSRMAVVALIALMAVPVLYGGLYLWANQDPYGKFGDVPVALVNADTGVAATDDADAADYGSDVAQELLDGGTFDWQLLSADAAAAALNDGAVDFTVTIPQDFSEALTSVGGDDPHQATILLETNDAVRCHALCRCWRLISRRISRNSCILEWAPLPPNVSVADARWSCGTLKECNRRTGSFLASRKRQPTTASFSTLRSVSYSSG
jgi:YhgE/Pip-like protein